MPTSLAPSIAMRSSSGDGRRTNWGSGCRRASAIAFRLGDIMRFGWHARLARCDASLHGRASIAANHQVAVTETATARCRRCCQVSSGAISVVSSALGGGALGPWRGATITRLTLKTSIGAGAAAVAISTAAAATCGQQLGLSNLGLAAAAGAAMTVGEAAATA